MAEVKTWITICSVISSIILILFALVQVTLSLGLNVRYDKWSTSIDEAAAEQGIISTASLLVLDALFIFPAAISGLCAAISRKFSVFVILLVIDALAFLAAVGGLIEISYLFDRNNLLSDAGSINDELAISIIVFQALVVVMTIFLGSFAIAAIAQAQNGREQDDPYLPKYEKHISDYRPSTIAYMTERRPVNDYGGGGRQMYRPLTMGSPEWDRFYDQLNSYYSQGAKSSRKQQYRSSSYRY